MKQKLLWEVTYAEEKRGKKKKSLGNLEQDIWYFVPIFSESNKNFSKMASL